MKWMIAVAIASAVTISVLAIAFIMAYSGSDTTFLQQNNPMGSMMGNGGMMSSTMMGAPQDVVILFESEYEVPAGKETEVKLKVLDKQTDQPVANAKVVIGIEEGLPMKTMEMQGGMFEARNERSGTYTFRFTPELEGYYTIHTHVILPSEPMHSMMENHVDFVVISKLIS